MHQLSRGALRSETFRVPFICSTCRARQLHTSSPRLKAYGGRSEGAQEKEDLKGLEFYNEVEARYVKQRDEARGGKSVPFVPPQPNEEDISWRTMEALRKEVFTKHRAMEKVEPDEILRKVIAGEYPKNIPNAEKGIDGPRGAAAVLAEVERQAHGNKSYRPQDIDGVLAQVKELVGKGASAPGSGKAKKEQ